MLMLCLISILRQICSCRKLFCLTRLGLSRREVGHTAQTNVIWLRAHKKTTSMYQCNRVVKKNTA